MICKHPLLLIGIVIVLSAIFGFLGTTVTYDGYDENVGDIVERTTEVRSLLSPDGIRFMLTSPVSKSSRPAMPRKRLVLPLPFAPTSAMATPGSTQIGRMLSKTSTR